MLVTELSRYHHVYPSPVHIYADHDGHALPVYSANVSMMAFPYLCNYLCDEHTDEHILP
jgi:hypothetical protein